MLVLFLRNYYAVLGLSHKFIVHQSARDLRKVQTELRRRILSSLSCVMPSSLCVIGLAQIPSPDASTQRDGKFSKF